jgi:transposase
LHPIYTPNIKGARQNLQQPFLDNNVNLAVAADIRQMNVLDDMNQVIEGKVLQRARLHDPVAFILLQTTTGVGEILAYTILYEIHSIPRFPSPQAFSSYCRLVKPERTSGGKDLGDHFDLFENGGRSIPQFRLKELETHVQGKIGIATLSVWQVLPWQARTR